MHKKELSIRQFIDGLARVRERLKHIARSLRIEFPTMLVQHEVDFFPKDDVTIIEFFLELSSEPGKYFCWWINLEPTAGDWIIGASLQHNEGEGENTLWELKHEMVATEELFLVISEILNRVEDFPRQRHSST